MSSASSASSKSEGNSNNNLTARENGERLGPLYNTPYVVAGCHAHAQIDAR